MEKKNPRIKSNIPLEDKINAIDTIVDSYFTDGEYTPYYSIIGQVTAIVFYFLEGIEIDADDIIYNIVTNDSELYELVNTFFDGNVIELDKGNYNMFKALMKEVDKIVDFKKEQLIYQNGAVSELKKLVSHQNEMLDSVSELCNSLANALNNFAQLSPNELKEGMKILGQLQEAGISEDTLTDIMRTLVNEKIQDHKVPETEYYEMQRQRIVEQQTQLQEKEKEIIALREWKRQHEK